MSRIGKLPIPVPEGVSIDITERVITVRGPKGELHQAILPGFAVEQAADNALTIVIKRQTVNTAKYYGLLRTLVANMVTGVSAGFEKQLEIRGVGFRASMQGANLVLNLGFSHPITVAPPEGIVLAVANNTQLTVSGYDKQKVGAVAAQIRALKKPEPYKGKGIIYAGEHVRRKAGKAAAKGATA